LSAAFLLGFVLCSTRKEAIVQEQDSVQKRLLAYCQQTKQGKPVAPLDLSGYYLIGLDVRGLDLSGVNLTGATLAFAQLEGTQLQGATLTRTSFPGVRIEALMASGLSPRTILTLRAEADRRWFSSLHFSPVPSSLAHLLLTAKECAYVCQALQKFRWEQVVDEPVFTVLYPTEPWDSWMARCGSRLILNWALQHRAFLNRTTSNIPFYGRVLPLTLIDEVEDADLVAGIKTNPERVFHALGVRQILKQCDPEGENVVYPRSPFGDAEGIVQITNRRALQLESGLMHHCVATYDSWCARGQRFIYHIGPAAPEGSTLEIFPDGAVGQHRAAYNRAPSVQDRNLLTAWLTSLGFEHDARTMMERICERLRQAGIAKVAFQIYWYADEDTVDDIFGEDQDGKEVALRTVSDEDLWNLVAEEHQYQHGWWKLRVEEKRLDRTGDETPPDEDDYDEDDYEEEA
jgi:hypothetical protein